MNKLCLLPSGSILYGLSTPTSDIDLKSVFIPEARDILLQRAPRVVTTGAAKGADGKTLAGETEEESFSLQFFLKLAAEGQSIPVEMLFSKPIGSADPLWTEIVDNRDRLLSKKSKGFLAYCKAQAGKFSVKGDRLAATRDALDMLQVAFAIHGSGARLGIIESDLNRLAQAHDAIEISTDDKGVAYLSVCGRKTPFTAALGLALDLVARTVEGYGARARMAETQQGADWKALSHALRVGYQAIELFETGSLAFPLARRDHLLAVKTGQVAFGDVVSEIDDLLPQVEAAAQATSLPDEPDHVWIEDFVADVYRDAVVQEIAPPRMRDEDLSP